MKHTPIAIALITTLGLASFAHAESIPAASAAEQHAIGSAIVKDPPVPADKQAKAPSVQPAPVMHAMTAPDNAKPSTKEFIETNSKMHGGMMIDFTGNADVDFVKGMIPHHQGAVDMANIALKYGKDPEIKKFAEDLIKAQSAEIKFMNEWLAKHPK